MRTITAILATIVVLSTAAQGSDFGAGLIIGEPTGISMKSWLDEEKAIDVGIAWSFVNEGHLHIHGDLLFHRFDVIKVNMGRLPLYFGPGVRILTGDDFHIGFRIVGGINYLFENAPMDVFLEVAPGLDLVESTDFFVNGGLGIRYWF